MTPTTPGRATPNSRPNPPADRPGQATLPKRRLWPRRRKGPLPPKTGWRRFVPRLRTTLLVAGGFLFAAVVGFIVLYNVVQIPAPNDAAIAQSTIITYSDGKTELGRIGSQNRQIVPLTSIPKHVRDAVLAAEDKNFYSEPGVSLTGIPRAILANIAGGGVKQGGSGITQQYAKVTYLTQQRTLVRKLKEVVIAIKIDRSTSKDAILGGYLNTIWFGRGASGIQAASLAYFHKPVSQLTVAEGAVLAGSIRGPAFYDPTNHPQAARGRWDDVTKAMLNDGFIDQNTYAGLKYPKVFDPQSIATTPGPERFIEEAVVSELHDRGFTDEDIQTLGLRVTTTIDAAAQRAADNAEQSVVQQAIAKAKKKPVSSLISIEPGTGRIKAMYGGQSFGEGGCTDSKANCLNLATQILRQPGSAFKPFVLSTAISYGVPVTQRFDGPATTTLKNGTPVRNDVDGETCGNCTLVEAMARSINTIYEPLAEQIGPAKVADHAHALGIPASVPLEDASGTGPSIALGAYDVHPIDMARAYATFAANGVRATPYLIESVKQASGKSRYKAKPDPQNVLDPGIAADVTQALQAVVTSGTGTRAQLAGRPAAGKTGTTEESRNAWFVGYTPQLSTAVWIGNVDNSPTVGQIPGYEKGLYGGGLPAMVFKSFMDGALKGQPVKNFPPPAHPDTPSPTPTPTTTSATPTPTTTSATPTVPVTTTAVPTNTGVPSSTVTDTGGAPPTTPPATTTPAVNPPT